MDAITIIPMVFPTIAIPLWGLTVITAEYIFAMWFGAALMLGWTLLLFWALLKPLERRFVAPLTIIVLIGLITANYGGWYIGAVGVFQFLSTLAIQTAILVVFLLGYLVTHNLPIR
jgi:hypothetical protein